ncbi:hypothetical protein HDV00_001414 [Rhizophlyctis rosea]|nr:hypothetical protein HDV00_001414 [Rhizophlyctis rosea]
MAQSVVPQEDGRLSITDLNLPVFKEKEKEVVPIEWYEELFQKQDLSRLTAKLPPSSTIPHLSIVIHIVGSRGDVQPFIALSKELQKHGHRVRIATHETFRKWVRGHKVEFYPLGGDPAELMAFMVENGGLIPSAASIARGDVGRKRKVIAEILQTTWKSCVEPDDETGEPFAADLIIANPPSFGHIHCAEKLGIPLHMSFTMPWSPTGSFPHPLTNIDHSQSVRKRLNFYSYGVVEYLTWMGLGDLVNDFRRSLGLRSMTNQQGTEAIIDLKVPYTYCWSPSLIPKPIDWHEHIDITGFYFLDQASNYDPPKDLLNFLHSGSPPIYIGFGSITGYDPKKLTSAVLEGVRQAGVRAIISKGWAGLGASDGAVAPPQDPNIYFIGDCPHDWLFQHVAAVCHHGGAGTLSAGLRCGKPTIVVPFFGDQFFWGAMVYRMKAGPMPIPAREMTAEKLAATIHEALAQPTVAKAAEIAFQMSQENGVALGVTSLYAHLPLDKLRSDIDPTHPARYSIPNLKLQISHNVAQVLACAGVITEEDLKLHKTKKWEIPLDHDQMIGVGAVKTIVQGFTGIFTDTAKGVKEALKEETREEKALAVGKGFSKGVGRVVFFPFRATALTLNEISDGMVRVPALWDPSYKPRHTANINNMATGAKESGKALFFGIYDGVSDFIMKPIEGGKKEGAKGAAKGFAVGSVNVLYKPLTGMVRSVALFGKGVTREVTNRREDKKVAGGVLGAESALDETTDWRQVAADLSGYDVQTCEVIVRKFVDVLERSEGGKGKKAQGWQLGIWMEGW